MLPTYSALVHLATICVRRLLAYLSLGHVPGPHSCFRPTPCSAPLPFVQSRIVEPFPVPQVGVSRVDEFLANGVPLALENPQRLHVAVESFNMNGSARPACKQYLLYLPPFDLTDRLETRQQTLVLLLSNRCCSLHIVASRILRSLEFDG